MDILICKEKEDKMETKHPFVVGIKRENQCCGPPVLALAATEVPRAG